MEIQRVIDEWLATTEKYRASMNTLMDKYNTELKLHAKQSQSAINTIKKSKAKR